MKVERTQGWHGSRTLTAAGYCFLLLTGLGGCSSSDSSLGATPGGAQDNDLANKEIDQGGVPKPEAITVEGLLNAHDLPLASVACEKDLCINAAYGVAPSLDTRRSAVFVQMGFDSGIDAATFTRSPLNLSVVVDRSGSMGGTKITAVRTALSRLIDQMNEADLLSLVLFNQSTEVLLPPTPVMDREAIRALLPKIVAGGTTNMASGMTTGFQQVAANAGKSGVSDRVMIFTDAQANTGEIDTSSFVNLVTPHAAEGIGLTVFGVGTDLNQDLVLAISRLRGSNYFFLQDSEKISTVFDQNFDHLVTPLAYDLKFTLVPGADFRVARVYGYSAWQDSQSSVSIEVASVFLSKNHGAIVARLEPKQGWPSGQPPIAELALSYTPAAGAAVVSESISTSYQGSSPLEDSAVYYSQPAVRRTVGFVNAALGEQSACSLFWAGNRSDAVALLNDTEQLLLSESAALEDLELGEEAEVVVKLRNNMQSNSTTYDGGTYYDDEGDGWPTLCTVGPVRGGKNWGLPALALGVALWVARRRRGAERG